MSYMVIKVYSFGCDYRDCDEFTDCTGPTLRDALREFRWSPLGWSINGEGRRRRIYCPTHSPAAGQE